LSSTREDQTMITVTIDQTQLDDRLAGEGQNTVVAFPVSTGSDVVAVELTGQMIKALEGKAAIVQIITDHGTYTLPALEINIDLLSAQFGGSVALQDIKLQIEV